MDGLDLTAFYAPYEPRMMVKVLLYTCDDTWHAHRL